MLAADATDIPYVTTAQMIEVDRAMVEDYRIELIQMMENAGRHLAHLARRRFLGGDARGKRVAVLAGGGGNGGGALVAARRLHNWGATVCVHLGKSGEAMAPVPARQLDILRRMAVPIAAIGATPDGRFDLVLDGLIGYSLRGAPHGEMAALIRWANRQQAPVLALDTPSGVDAGKGTAYDPAIRASVTLTLALPKRGFLAAEVKAYLGELYVGDIGVPPSLYAAPALGLQAGAWFARDEIVRLS
jgi:NAD(P)H-hydrate epimerase